ncbi:MAG: SPOR domain-containing protein [Acidobacteriota bacterium]|jgi:cell division protein FtsN|nr:SPOR domain-containing protein [Acidobacteriota bacterium]
MGYQANENDGRDLELNNRTLTMLFVGLLAICGVFFVAGRSMRPAADLAAETEYGEGYASSETAPFEDGDAAVTDPGGRRDAAEPESATRPNEASTPPAATEEPASPAASTPPPQVAVVVPPPAPKPKPAVEEKPKPAPPKEAPKPAAEAPKSSVESIVKEAAKKVLPPATPAASGKSSWSVQVAAFHARRETELKAKELKEAGFEPRIEVPHPPDDWYRLKIGKFATRAEANEMASRVKGRGFDAIVKENKDD